MWGRVSEAGKEDGWLLHRRERLAGLRQIGQATYVEDIIATTY